MKKTHILFIVGLLITILLSSCRWLELKSSYNNIQDETLKTFYENGTLQSEGNFKNGKREGLSKIFYKNGNLKAEINYKNGKKEGLFKTFYENGNLQAELSFKNDKLEGLTKTFYENSNLQEEASFKNGKQEGVTRGYSNNGNLIIEITYNEDSIKKAFCYSNDGKIKELNNAQIYNYQKGSGINCSALFK